MRNGSGPQWELKRRLEKAALTWAKIPTMYKPNKEIEAM